jgi:hypothetical protein
MSNKLIYDDGKKLRRTDDGLSSDLKLTNDVLPIKKYNPTTADVTNTATLTPFITQAFEANEWEDGEVIEIWCAAEIANGGTPGTGLIKLHFGAQAAQINPTVGNLAGGLTAGQKAVLIVRAMRAGTSILIMGAQSGVSAAASQDHWDADDYIPAIEITGCDFTAAADLKLSVTFGEASASDFITVVAARILKY